MTCSKLVLDRSALVAYGSETGNAYDYAEELGRMLERIHFRTTVSSLDAVVSPARKTHFKLSNFR